MKKNNKMNKKKSMPTSFILIMIWMFIAVYSIISKLLDPTRFALNVQLMGFSLTLFDYFMDLLILVGFVIFIYMFFKRLGGVKKYFHKFIYVLILGEIAGLIIGIINLNKVVELTGLKEQGIPSGFLLFLIILTFIFHIFI